MAADALPTIFNGFEKLGLFIIELRLDEKPLKPGIAKANDGRDIFKLGIGIFKPVALLMAPTAEPTILFKPPDNPPDIPPVRLDTPLVALDISVLTEPVFILLLIHLIEFT